MKFSISNIAWDNTQNEKVYSLMKEYGFEGLEIAPTKIYPVSPYDRVDDAKKWGVELQDRFGFHVSSMQSIWFGRTESIFSTQEERDKLIAYTKKAIDFAAALGCKNLVFGCPKNRNKPNDVDDSVAINFFKEVGDYAFSKNTCIGMEANPTIYNTNYINTTKSAFELIENVNSKGFKLNLDVGTMIYNNEDANLILSNVDVINHVHISEPYLKIVQERELHKELFSLLRRYSYSNYVSIEMGKVDNLTDLEVVMKYVNSL